MTDRKAQAAALAKDWAENPRWKGIKRGYSAADVVRLRGSFQVEHTLARRGAEKLWNLVNTEPFVNTLGALTGNQAMQQVKAGLKAIYLSGWQVAADANDNGEMYPDQSLYSVDSVPKVVKRINSAFQRADQIQWSEGKNDVDYFAPIVADAEAGFGGVLNAFELMKAMIEAGAGFLRIMSLAWGFLGMQFALTGVFRASGNMVLTMVLTLVSQWVVQFPLAYVLSKHTDLHEQGIWWALPIANIVTALITLCIYAKGDWKKKRLIEPEEELAGKVTEDILVGEVSR